MAVISKSRVGYVCNCQFILTEFSVAVTFIVVLPFSKYPQIKNIGKHNLKVLRGFLKSIIGEMLIRFLNKYSMRLKLWWKNWVLTLKFPDRIQDIRISKIILMLMYFAYGLLEENHFIYIHVLDSINWDLDFRFSEKNLNSFILNTFLPDSSWKSWIIIGCVRY